MKKMNRIKKMFDDLKKKDEKALIAYITAGDPDIVVTEKLIEKLIDSGADMIELGVPFSDPMADGPTIQAASQRALKNPFSIKEILNLVKKLRKYSSIPVILFGYYNPFLQYGLNRLCRDAAEAGVDGFLTVDLPPEEAEDFKNEADSSGMDMIFLLAPTSTDDRMDIVSGMGSGFIYYVSVTGVTGARSCLAEMIEAYVSKIRTHSDLPVGIGFGISTPEHVREVCSYADAVIVGCAIIKQMEANMNKPDMYEKVSDFVRSLKKATRSL
jgi:tryptophan synthase alpha chain